MQIRVEKVFIRHRSKSKKANIAVDPLLTNPLNSATKLQISAT
jgi:hypothetical protein